MIDLFPPYSDLHVLRGPSAVHRPREPPLGAPERAAHGRREAGGRAPGLQTPQVIPTTRTCTSREDNSVNIEELSERIRFEDHHATQHPDDGDGKSERKDGMKESEDDTTQKRGPATTNEHLHMGEYRGRQLPSEFKRPQQGGKEGAHTIRKEGYRVI